METNDIQGDAEFSADERDAVYKCIFNRRDVRGQFLPDPIPDQVLASILTAAHHAPSVGFMQPWDFIVIRDPGTRRGVQENFERANREAAALYSDGRRALYDNLKLAAILEAPVNLCVTCDPRRQK